MNRIKTAVAVFCAAVAFAALTSCGSNGDAADPPVGGLTTTAGDGYVTVSWTDDTALDYWLFVSTDPTLTVDNFSTRTDIRILRNVRSPYTLCGYPDGRTLYLAMNARTRQGPGGPGTPTTSATIRAAGEKWTAGSAPAFDYTAVGFGPATSCLTTGTPTGTFVAVGTAGTIATSTDGRTFAAGTPPAGFTTDLTAVATYTTTLNVAGNTGQKIVAVGTGSASIVSSDGVTWSAGAAFDATKPTLNAIAVNAGVFIAVGDGGAVRTTTDGITWTDRTSGVTASLRGIACSGIQCIVAGDNGTVLRTIDSGVTWTTEQFTGTTNLKRVAYGNFNNNLGSTGTSINTWVVVGEGGGAYYSLDGGVTYTAGTGTGTANLIAISYLTRFVAIDATGNAYLSLTGATWTGPVATGLSVPTGLIGNGVGFVGVGAGGQAVSAFDAP